MDLFKAIFENSEPSSSSSSSSSEASDAEDKQEMKIDSQTMNSLKPAGHDDTRPATAPDVTSAAVSDAAPLTLQLPSRQQADGMILIVLNDTAASNFWTQKDSKCYKSCLTPTQRGWDCFQ